MFPLKQLQTFVRTCVSCGPHVIKASGACAHRHAETGNNKETRNSTKREHAKPSQQARTKCEQATPCAATTRPVTTSPIPGPGCWEKNAPYTVPLVSDKQTLRRCVRGGLERRAARLVFGQWRWLVLLAVKLRALDESTRRCLKDKYQIASRSVAAGRWFERVTPVNVWQLCLDFIRNYPN